MCSDCRVPSLTVLLRSAQTAIAVVGRLQCHTAAHCMSIAIMGVDFYSTLGGPLIEAPMSNAEGVRIEAP